MLFDLDIENKRFKANKTPKKKRTMSSAALDAATTLNMNERQRANSAPAPFGVAATTATETSKNPPQQAFRSTLNPIWSFSTQTTSDTASFATSFDSAALEYDHSVTFGPNDLLALSPATVREDAERQAALIKVRPTRGMTMKRRMLAEEGLPAGDEQLMMSGGLDAGDVRCEVCQAEKRAMDGLAEAGISAL